jgi:hypothetical protein
LRHFFLALLILIDCASQDTKETTWPEDLPPRAYFLGQYQNDLSNKNCQHLDEYLTWITRFYQGWEMYPNGWNTMVQEVLQKNKNPKSAEAIKIKLDRLGLLIAGEWAKNNHTRLINTHHVSLWVKALLKSADHGETLEILDRAFIDVNGLLTHKIATDVITADRYYALDDEAQF